MAAPESIMNDHKEDDITLDDIIKARNRIKGYVTETPVFTCGFMDKLAGRKLHFKGEMFQKSGSFKYRGVTNSILRLKEAGKDNLSVVTHSSGNHGQAVALASSIHGVKGYVVVPEIAPQVKKNAIKGYGAILRECESTAQARAATAEEIIVSLKGEGEYIPSADHPFVVEGQGSIGLEIMQQIPNLDAVVVPCGTGGCLSGVALACKLSNPNIKVFGAEPLMADDTARSKQQDQRITLTDYPKTVADGLRMSVGECTWPIIRKHVDDVITVTEDEIVRGMFLMWERMKLVSEPSGCVPLAAVLTEKFRGLTKDMQNVAIIVTGGNLDLTKLPWMTGKYDVSV